MKLPKSIDQWMPRYLEERVRRAAELGPKPKRVWLALTDHYEPMGGRVSLEQGHERVDHWLRRWPEIAAAAPRDSEGKPPCFTFFYPQEEYQPSILSALEPLVRARIADVDVHIHHDNETAAGFTQKMRDFLHILHERHGLLRMHHGRLTFGFIHGNWALDNSRPDGRLCGVTGELQLLRDLNCYADFTMPSVPSTTQGGMVNRIFWTNGDPHKPRGFDVGTAATPGGGRRGDLLMIPGPLGLRFRDRLMPRIETGEIACYDAPTAYRAERWLDLAPRLGDDIFVKLYGHSAREDNAAALLGKGGADQGTLLPMFHAFQQAAQRRGLELHWASAFDLYRAVERIVQIHPIAAPLPELETASA